MIRETASASWQVGGYGNGSVVSATSSASTSLGVRFYEPGVGRFTQADPIVEAFGRYSYSGDRPVIATDPLGLAYMIWDGGLLTLYHGDGGKWLSCAGESGAIDRGLWPEKGPVAPGLYVVRPDEIQWAHEYLDHWQMKLKPENWGDWRVHMTLVNGWTRPGYEGYPHQDTFIHGGHYGRGTWGCIRIPDQPPLDWVVIPGRNGVIDCLTALMGLLKGIGHPVKVRVLPPLSPDLQGGCKCG